MPFPFAAYQLTQESSTMADRERDIGISGKATLGKVNSRLLQAQQVLHKFLLFPNSPVLSHSKNRKMEFTIPQQ